MVNWSWSESARKSCPEANRYVADSRWWLSGIDGAIAGRLRGQLRRRYRIAVSAAAAESGPVGYHVAALASETLSTAFSSARVSSFMRYRRYVPRAGCAVRYSRLKGTEWVTGWGRLHVTNVGTELPNVMSTLYIATVNVLRAINVLLYILNIQLYW